MTSRSHSLLLAVALSAAVAACGGGSTAPTAASTVAAPHASAGVAESTPEAAGTTAVEATCATLLSNEELANPALLGAPPAKLTEGGYPGAVDCRWTYTAPDATASDFLSVLVNANADNTSTWSAMASDESREDGEAPIAVDGIGDESYTWVGQGDYRKLFVRRGERTLIVRGPKDLHVFADESSMIDFADRLFGRF